MSDNKGNNTNKHAIKPNGSHAGLFHRFAKVASAAAGRPFTFIAAVAVVIVWASTGPIFGFSDTWQLIINTGTTIVTFLMVFLIQNTQNRDTMAVQLKLDELINAVKDARNEMIDVEDMSDQELEEKRQEMVELAAEAKETIEELEERVENASGDAKRPE